MLRGAAYQLPVKISLPVSATTFANVVNTLFNTLDNIVVESVQKKKKNHS